MLDRKGTPNRRKFFVQVFAKVVKASKDGGFTLHQSRVFKRVDPKTGNVLYTKKGKSRKVKFVQTLHKGEPVGVRVTHVIKHRPEPRW